MQELKYHQRWSSLQHGRSPQPVGSCQLPVAKDTSEGNLRYYKEANVIPLSCKLAMSRWLWVVLQGAVPRPLGWWHCIWQSSLFPDQRRALGASPTPLCWDGGVRPFHENPVPSFGLILWPKCPSFLLALALPHSSSSRETKHGLFSEVTAEGDANAQSNEQLSCTGEVSLPLYHTR